MWKAVPSPVPNSRVAPMTWRYFSTTYDTESG
jgi:hypothetical protein